MLPRLSRDLAEMRADVGGWIGRIRRAAGRATPAPALVRAGLVASTVVALAAGWPADLVLRGAFLVLLIAPLPALFPGSMTPTLVILLAIGGYLGDTVVSDTPASYPRLVILAGAGYLVHALAALAAVLPYDAVVSTEVLARSLMRAALVVVLTAGLALFAVAVPEQLGGRYLIGSLAGLVIMIGLAAYLASLARRR